MKRQRKDSPPIMTETSLSKDSIIESKDIPMLLPSSQPQIDKMMLNIRSTTGIFFKYFSTIASKYTIF